MEVAEIRKYIVEKLIDSGGEDWEFNTKKLDEFVSAFDKQSKEIEQLKERLVVKENHNCDIRDTYTKKCIENTKLKEQLKEADRKLKYLNRDNELGKNICVNGGCLRNTTLKDLDGKYCEYHYNYIH